MIKVLAGMAAVSNNANGLHSLQDLNNETAVDLVRPFFVAFFC
jgi:hypothetical protein